MTTMGALLMLTEWKYGDHLKRWGNKDPMYTMYFATHMLVHLK